MMQQQQQPYKYSLDSVGMNVFSILEEENTNVTIGTIKENTQGKLTVGWVWRDFKKLLST